MTETKPFSQDKKTYFSIVLNTAIKKRWWMYLLVLLVSLANIYYYVVAGRSSHLVWSLVGFGYLLFILIHLYIFAHSKDKDEFLSEKQLFFNDDAVRLEESSGGFGEIPYTRIKKVVDKSNFWMLYLSKNQFLYVPKDIFYSETDFERFRQLIYTAGDNA
jgi:hypothetical protein